MLHNKFRKKCMQTCLSSNEAKFLMEDNSELADNVVDFLTPTSINETGNASLFPTTSPCYETTIYNLFLFIHDNVFLSPLSSPTKINGV